MTTTVSWVKPFTPSPNFEGCINPLRSFHRDDIIPAIEKDLESDFVLDVYIEFFTWYQVLYRASGSILIRFFAICCFWILISIQMNGDHNTSSSFMPAAAALVKPELSAITSASSSSVSDSIKTLGDPRSSWITRPTSESVRPRHFWEVAEKGSLKSGD